MCTRSTEAINSIKLGICGYTQNSRIRINMYTHTRKHIHTYTVRPYKHTRICAYMPVYAYTNVRIHIQTRQHTNIHTYTHTHIHINTPTHIHA